MTQERVADPTARPSRKKADGAPNFAVDVMGLGRSDDALILDPDTVEEGKHYRFFHSSNRRIARARALGYRVVKRSESGVSLLSGDDAGAAEDVIRVGDMVLYECDEEAFKERRKATQKLSNARLNTPEGQFRKRARQSGTPVVGKDKSDG